MKGSYGPIEKRRNTLELADQLELERLLRLKTAESVQRSLQTLSADSSLTNGFIRHLLTDFCRVITETLTSLGSKKRGVKPSYYRIAEELQQNTKDFPEICGAVTLRTIINLILTNGNLTLSYVSLQIGHSILAEVRYNKFIEGGDDRDYRYIESLNMRFGEHYRETFMQKAYSSNDFVFRTFTNEEQGAIGLWLVHLLVHFSDMFELQGKSATKCIRPTQIFIDTLEENKRWIVDKAISYTPTIIPPKPWTDMYTGGYYGDMRVDTVFMRHPFYIKKTHRLRSYVAQLNELDLSFAYGAVNKIQSTPYKIRKDILQIIQTLFDEDSGVCELPHKNPPIHPPRLPDNVSEEELKKYKKMIGEMYHAEKSRQGKALRTTMLLELAKKFSEYPKIWFPHNMDFRGRIYPIPIGINPQGDDLVKGILAYANPVSCTDDGDLSTLAIAGAGFAGIDKVSYAESEAWVYEHEEQILDSAEAPLEYRWWSEQDEPFQFLHFCKEWKRCKEYIEENGSIIGFECDLKIPFDGTCSGLQHYSCLLRDEIGGSAVNLVDHERPADIYQQVSDRVVPLVEKDLLSTIEAKRLYAQAWMAHGINRKVVKRCVMTLAYGSAQYGFGNQLWEDWTKNDPIFKGIQFKSAQYLAKYIYQEVGGIVVKAMEGMKYLKYLAGVLVSEGYPIEWVTPLGLPVQQIYLKMTTSVVQLNIAGVRYRLYSPAISKKEELAKTKQVNGIAPNFIHSLDAAHLMMVVNDTCLSNITTIHDSFGTSLGETATLKKALRVKMVELYSKHSPLQEFREHVESLTGKECLPPPDNGLLDINSILKSSFIFH